MNAGVFYPLLFLAAILMAVVPFAVLLGGTNLLGMEGLDAKLLIAYFAVAAILGYVISFGSFAIFQKSNCDEVKNWKQVSLNALISVGIQLAILGLVMGVPWFRRVVTQIIPPDTPEPVQQSLAYGYYAFWSTLMGVGLGGTLSSSCAYQEDPINIPIGVPPTPFLNEYTNDVNDYTSEVKESSGANKYINELSAPSSAISALKRGQVNNVQIPL